MSQFLKLIRPLVAERVANMIISDSVEFAQRPSFCDIFKESTPAIIAEIKYSTPAKGLIYQGHLSDVDIAKAYVDAGARALSILTEPHYFSGSTERFKRIHQILPHCPLILKDFVLSIKQIQQAKNIGASAVLLIAGFLTKEALHELYHATLSLGLMPLVEIHDLNELDEVLELPLNVIGINNRNLETLRVDLETTSLILPYIPDDIYVISESGIHSAKQIQQFHQLGCDGFLIGSHLMTKPNPGIALQKLLKGGEYAR